MGNVRQARLRILFVPDTLFWVTATIAREIARHNPWIEPTICSHSALPLVFKRCDDLADRIDLVHFLTPHIATARLPWFEGRVPCVSSIYHVEDERSVEPEPRCDAIMTISEQWHDHLVDSGVDEQKLVRVTMGVLPEQFRPPSLSERRRLRRRLGLPPDGLVIGFNAKRTSDSHGRKGTDVLVDALTELRRRLPDASCLLVGPGWSDLASRLGGGGGSCVHLPFVLNRSDLAAVYRCFDVFWVTSRIEGGPVPLLEAMSSGSCCVTTPVGIAREIVRDGENAFLAPIDDVATFVDRTVALAGDAELRRRMGRAAREAILEGYTWDRTTRTARSLYQTAVDRFRLRFPGVEAADLPAPDATVRSNRGGELNAIPPGLRSEVRAREYLNFSGTLRSMGADGPAELAATRAISCRPFDRALWREAGPKSSLSGPFLQAQRVLRRFRALPGSPGSTYLPVTPSVSMDREDRLP